MSAPTGYPPPNGPPLSPDEPPIWETSDAGLFDLLLARFGGERFRTRRARSQGYRWGVLAVLGGLYVGALAGSIATRGIPKDREQVLAWMMGALIVVAFASPRHRVSRVLTDWLPFLLVMVVYDYSRGWAETAGMPLHWYPQIRADRFLFGGVLPTVWLQDHLLDPDRVHLWEVVPAITYVSHFVVPFVVAAYLWVRERERYLRFARRFVTLSWLGVATFILFPAAPPWLAARTGRLDEHISRPAGRGWGRLHLHFAEQILHKGQASVNLTAAIPSLHAGYAALVAAFLWPTLGRVGRTVVGTYAVLMGVVLVYGGEHYVTDVLVGWAYVGLTLWLVGSLEGWWAGRRFRAEDSDPDPAS
jgi:membrane-associated phospholipid phosphatase